LKEKTKVQRKYFRRTKIEVPGGSEGGAASCRLKATGYNGGAGVYVLYFARIRGIISDIEAVCCDPDLAGYKRFSRGSLQVGA
jgi:hypothetical protein